MKKIKDRKICNNCKFYDTNSQFPFPICRCLPPINGWAKVCWLDWCGEFTRKENVNEDT